ncbi:hypothetical protein ACFLZX_05375 [Nanoarchaeota archaeon]
MKGLNLRLTVIILGVLLVVAISYIVIGEFQEKKQQEQLTIYQQGAQYGYEQAVLQIVQQAITCQPVPLFVQNQTINMVAVECLQQG